MEYKFDQGTSLWAISDVHGDYKRLVKLLQKLDILDEDGDLCTSDARVIFVGDYIDKGDQPFEVLELVRDLVESGRAKALMGNHDFWLQRYLNGADVMLTPERKATLSLITQSDPDWKDKGEIKAFLDSLPFFLDMGDFKFAHAVYSQSSAAKDKKGQRFMLYGPVDKTVPPSADGKPNRIPWYTEYDGRYGTVIFGHYSLSNEVSEFTHAVCVDCGVFNPGGRLAAYEVHSKRKVYV